MRPHATPLRAILCAMLVAATASAQTWEQGPWERTVYYRTELSTSGADAGVLRLTAAGRYEAFLNGAALCADDDFTTVEACSFTAASGTNELIVAVTDRGSAHGHGLIADIEAGPTASLTRPGNRADAWRWSDQDPAGVDWSRAPLVQAGRLDLRALRAFGGLNLLARAVSAFPGDVALADAPRGVGLSRIDGANLALGRPSNQAEANDGVLTTAWNAGVNSLNKFVAIDLRSIRRVNGVRVLTAAPRGREAFRDNSLRGYSIQVSDDQFRWSEVAVLHGITDYEETSLTFAPVRTRYVRLVVAEIDGVSSPRVAEIEVYGEGYSETGQFLSPPLDLGVTGPKNFGAIRWTAQVPPRTSLSLQFRSGDDGVAWSEWTAAGESDGRPALVPEPARWLQYRANLTTRDEERTPYLRHLEVDFSPEDIAASRATGSVTPLEVEMGVEAELVYSLDVEIGPQDLGVERVLLATPGPARLDETQPLLGAGASAVDLAGVAMVDGVLHVPIEPPLRQTARLQLRLHTTQYAIAHDYRAQLLAPGSDNPLNARQSDDAGAAWRTLARPLVDGILHDVAARPAVLTPNGDGRNDGGLIEFTLAKVADVRVRIDLYRLDGSRVRALFDGALQAGTYTRSLSPARPEVLPGYWDGRDDAGDLVAPGLYVYRLDVSADRLHRTRTGTVGVAY